MDVALIGYGYWGHNVLRNLVGINEIRRVYVLTSDKRKKHIDVDMSKIIIVDNADEIFDNKAIISVFIITPPAAHYDLCKKALLSDKHVFVEKPFTVDYSQAVELYNLEKERGKILFIDHIYLYTPALQYIKNLIDSGDIGNILYYESRKYSTGKVYAATSIFQDAVIHDLAIIDYIGGKSPSIISVLANNYICAKYDTVSLNLQYANFNAFIHASCIFPCKVRESVIYGTKKVIVYDESLKKDKVKIYENFVSKCGDNIEFQITEAIVPEIDYSTEPLKKSIIEFINCIINKVVPISNSEQALRIAEVIESAEKIMLTK